MSITPKQALKALYWLQESKDNALLVHHCSGSEREFHIEDLERNFSRAAEALGFKLVAVESNQLRVIEGGAA